MDSPEEMEIIDLFEPSEIYNFRDTHFSTVFTPREDRPHFKREDVPKHMIVDSITADNLWPKGVGEEWAEKVKWAQIKEVDSVKRKFASRTTLANAHKEVYVLKDDEITVTQAAQILGTTTNGVSGALKRHGMTMKTVYMKRPDSHGKIRLQPVHVLPRKPIEELVKTAWRR